MPVTGALRWVSAVHPPKAHLGSTALYGLLTSVITACHPVGRAWPDKCEYCIARGLPCTAPRTKKDFNGSVSAQGGDGSTSETNAENRFQRPEDDAIGVPSISRPLSEVSDFDAPASAAPTLVMPRIKRVKSGARDSEISSDKEVEQLRDTIRRMEDEFMEVLGTEKENHQVEIRALKDKHREELNQQRERYESRIDDLIKIMKKM
ncbi:hypothetical protein F5Y05DRAFT_408732 [Hypoxylon sp. FL0543]|nr:hypothetical protein F5Y05DRAFT_408732 [Hypoxylon sp. FL0543]